MQTPGYYVTGTDTGIGKSLASASLLHALRARGVRAVGMKPVASGCERTAEGWRNEDALLLQQASQPVPRYEDVNPIALPAPLAPEIAAADAGIDVYLQPLLDAYARLGAQADRVVVEGVGGWLAPLSDVLDQSELVAALKLPVVMVVGLRLGCINHARLTARAITASGAKLAGWIASEVDPHMARMHDNFRLLHSRIDAPCWGLLPHAEHPDPRRLASALHLPG